MIPLVIPARSEAAQPFVIRLEHGPVTTKQSAELVAHQADQWVFSGPSGLFQLITPEPVIGDVVLVDPERHCAERLIRHDSPHNTFLVTERCDQLCVMCSQPPKKHHHDRFDIYTQAALLAPHNALIGFSGGEPTLYKAELFALLRTLNQSRPDLSFHVLSNGQHFTEADAGEIAVSAPSTLWGIPLYSPEAAIHDAIVAKPHAYDALLRSLEIGLRAGMRIELRTVILQSNFRQLPRLARMIADHLGFIAQWSIMQLENIGFAKNRFLNLYVDHSTDFEPIAAAIDTVQLAGIPVSLFNMTRCSVPQAYRPYAAASISDWKRRYATDCDLCSEQGLCGGFFAWHSEEYMVVNRL